MVLDDVMSELDSSRRERLVELLGTGGQSLITAAEGSLIPDSPAVTRVSMLELLDAASRNGSDDPKADG
jgi:recombinational DNA repair ATPase RecF